MWELGGWVGSQKEPEAFPALLWYTAQHTPALLSIFSHIWDKFFIGPLQPPCNKGCSALTQRISGPMLTTGAQSSAIGNPFCPLPVTKSQCHHSQGWQGVVLCPGGTFVTMHNWGWACDIFLSASLNGYWRLEKPAMRVKSDSMSYLGKLKALCQFDGKRFSPEWDYWHFLSSESITPKGLQFNF